MRLKPKSSVRNPRALLYRRFTDLESSFNHNNIYKTPDNKFWSYDATLYNASGVANEKAEEFVEIVDKGSATPIVIDTTKVYAYKTAKYKYVNNKWVYSSDTADLQLKFGNIATRYQINKYYYVGSFDYMIKGSIEGTETQHLKGNIMSLDTLDIATYNDYINLDHDDLIVIGNRLFSVENIEMSQKRMPKIYNIYFATLNSII